MEEEEGEKVVNRERKGEIGEEKDEEGEEEEGEKVVNRERKGEIGEEKSEEGEEEEELQADVNLSKRRSKRREICFKYIQSEILKERKIVC